MRNMVLLIAVCMSLPAFAKDNHSGSSITCHAYAEVVDNTYSYQQKYYIDNYEHDFYAHLNYCISCFQREDCTRPKPFCYEMKELGFIE